MGKRIISLFLCLVLVLGLLPAINFFPAQEVQAATTSQNNIVARADYLYNITWTAQSTVYGWNYNYTFYAGNTYRIPYGQPINSGAYIGYYVSIEDFISAANTAGSVFYTSRSTYSSTSSVYYATDCSAFVSWCWGIDRKTTYSIPQVSTYIGMATASNAYSLQLGDCLNSNDVGHVVLVTDLIYSGSTLTSIEITEQTPPQLKRSYYTPTELGNKYGTYYGIYRYSGSVPAAPDGSTNDDTGSSPSGSTGSTTTITSKYYPACDASQTSLIAAMASIGVDMDWTLQTEIAALNGITNFTGTAEQNTTLLNLLKAGTLLNPNYVPITYYPACASSCTTFYEGMSDIGITCDWTLHSEIAAANGITDFSGTAEQNETLLSLLKAGKLIVPGSGTEDSSGSSSGSSVVDGKTGYDRGYAGGMAGSGEYKAFGLDVSSWQGSDLDFTRIKNGGYDYVILRAGTTNGKDECFETYYTAAKAAGLDVGVYYYSYATSVSAVKTDMEKFISYIAGKTYEYPVYFDYEDSSQQALSTSLSQEICLTAMDMLAAEGYLVGMYTGKYFSTLLPMDTICAKYEVWIAHYLGSGTGYDGTGDYWKYGPTYASQYGMYQFTDSVWINGYGPYDGDVCYKDYPTIVKTYGFNGYTVESEEPSYIQQNCTFYPAHCTIEVTTANNLYTEPRSASDVIEAAPLGTTYVANGLYVNGGGNLWYRVTSSTGEVGYIYSGRVKFVDNITGDIMIKNHTLPENHTVGNVFTVSGSISSTYNKLGNVSVYIYSGNTTSGTPVTGGTAASSNNAYSLAGSAIDDATSFGDLAEGTYTYVISADYTSYYAAGTKELGTTTATINLVEHVFEVGDGSSGDTSTESSYFDKCTFYPSRCTFTTTRDTGIFSEPRTQKTGNTSVKLEDAPNGTTYTSTGLYVNSGDNIFYQVLTSDGQTGYIYSGYTVFGKKAYDDIKLSGATMPNGHVEGTAFSLSGTVKSTYNVLGTLKVSVYSGFGTSGTLITGGSAEVSNNKYTLAGSSIDDATLFNKLPAGNYTYHITVTFSSYYAESAKVLGVNSGTRTLKKYYFTVVESAVDQDSCSHDNTVTIVAAPTCTATGTQVTSCSICGLTEKSTAEALGHSYGSYTVTVPATCTTAGSKEKTCSACGKVYTKAIAAKGHSYEVTVIPATCSEYAINKFSCSGCGDSYQEYAGEYTDWSTTKPSGIDSSLIQTKTQYRYKDYSTTTSYEADLDGYTLVSSAWEQTGTGKVTYVKSWPSGFPTDSNTYATYNKIGDKVSASETATNKTEVNSDAVAGYLWYHWCTNGSTTSMSYETNTYWCFHVFFSTTTPSQANNYDSSDGSYLLSSSTQCSYCQWYWPVAVYEQNYTTYQNLFTYEKWSSWSAWSDEEVTASDTREVETRTVYRYLDAELGDHTWNEGTVTTAPSCTGSGVRTYVCTSCQTTKTETIGSSGHDYKATVTAPTCTAQGYTTHKCANCGDSYTDSYIDAKGHSYVNGTCSVCGTGCSHNWGSGTVTTQPGCTTTGVRTYTCSVCKHTKTESIAANGHNYSSNVTAPTCLAQGYTTHTCSVCSHSYKDSYTNPLSHNYEGMITTAPTCTTAGIKTFTCSRCSDSYTEMISAPGHAYEHTVTAPTCTEQGFTTHTCTTCGHSYKDSYKDALSHSYSGNVTTDATCTTAGVKTYTCSKCSDSYTEIIPSIGHSYKQTVTVPTCTEQGYTTHTCDTCKHSYKDNITNSMGHSYSGEVTTAPTCTTEGVKTYTCSNCSDSYTESIDALGHSYAGGKCDTCGDTKTVSLPGSFNDWNVDNVMNWTENGYTYTLELAAGTYTFKLIKDGAWLGNNGTIVDTTTATSDIGWEFVDAGDCTLVSTGGIYYFTFNFDTNMLVITNTHVHNYIAGEVVAPTCTAGGYTVYTCVCNDSYHGDEIDSLGHTEVIDAAVDATCTESGLTEGKHCEVCGEITVAQEEVAALGHSEVIDAAVDATCTESGLTEGKHCEVCGEITVAQEEVAALGHSEVIDAAVDATCTESGLTEGKHCEVCGEITVAQEEVAALGHSYADGICGTCGEADPDYIKPIVQPVITVGSPSVSFEGEIRYNIYFSASQLDDVAEMGLALFNTKVADGTVETADQVIPGYTGENGSYMVQTDGIAPKNMGDALYFRIYAKLTDGSYIYTDIRGYNAIVYANNILKNSTDANMRSLVVAMLNYGAAAQQSLNYKTDSLMNAGLTDAHQALVKPYDANMMDDLVAVDASKVGNFAYNSAGFSGRKPSVSFDGAFAINYYFTTKFAPENGMKLYYWTLADYNAAATLTAENASGSMDMTDLGNNQFWGHVEDIVARDIDQTVFVAAVYTYGGVEYATGVLAYSVGSYCESMIAAEAGSATQAMTPICSGAAVYGFYAKEYFTALAQNNPA